jgi:nucleoside-diphosphate-sugar epimerase
MEKYFHIGKASNLVSMTYVKNLVDLTILLSTAEQAKDEIFFANDFHPYTMREVADTAAAYYGRKLSTVPNFIAVLIAYSLGIFKLLGFNVPLYPFRLWNIKANYCYDVQKSVRLGYLPKYDLQTGIYETLEWYEHKLWNRNDNS